MLLRADLKTTSRYVEVATNRRTTWQVEQAIAIHRLLAREEAEKAFRGRMLAAIHHTVPPNEVPGDESDDGGLDPVSDLEGIWDGAGQ